MEVIIDQFDNSDPPIMTVGKCKTCGSEDRILVELECTDCLEARFGCLDKEV